MLITPPIFDALPVRAKGKLQKPGAERYSWELVSDDYDQVVEQCANWITGQTRLADLVIDIHTPMEKAVTIARTSDPSFTFTRDGIHYNQHGYRFVAKSIFAALPFGTCTLPIKHHHRRTTVGPSGPEATKLSAHSGLSGRFTWGRFAWCRRLYTRLQEKRSSQICRTWLFRCLVSS